VRESSYWLTALSLRERIQVTAVYKPGAPCDSANPRGWGALPVGLDTVIILQMKIIFNSVSDSRTEERVSGLSMLLVLDLSTIRRLLPVVRLRVLAGGDR
jgi:hypothetical protein